MDKRYEFSPQPSACDRSTLTAVKVTVLATIMLLGQAPALAATADHSSAPIPDPADAVAAILAAPEGDGSHRHPQNWYEQDTWITDIGTLLYGDQDHDGYFSGFSLSLDADTRYTDIDVYAALDIQRIPGLREHLHTSADFTLYGNTPSDEYRIDIELINNYPIGDYNLSIELRDAQDHRVLDSVDATHFSNLSALPLESAELDTVPQSHIVVQIPVHNKPLVQNDDIRVEEYAGSSGWAAVSLLFAWLSLRWSLHACPKHSSLILRKLWQRPTKRAPHRAFILREPLRSAARFCVLEDSHRDGRLPCTTPALAGRSLRLLA